MNIYDFLLALNDDEDLQRLWLDKGPVAAMNSKDVSETDQKIILTGDLKSIMAAVNASVGENAAWIIWMGPTIWPWPHTERPSSS